MLSKTLEKELSAYEIGAKVHALRQARDMKLIELGKHTGMSAAMLSKIERGRLVPTLPTLMRIALVFSVGLDHFFTDQRKRHAFAVVRKQGRIRLPAMQDKRNVPYDFESLDYEALQPRLNAFLAHFRPLDPRKVPLHKHSGVEFIYMLNGVLELTWFGEVHTLQAGDAVYFDSSIEHGYRALGSGPCAGVVVTLPK